jgi:hypothetical protein
MLANAEHFRWKLPARTGDPLVSSSSFSAKLLRQTMVVLDTWRTFMRSKNFADDVAETTDALSLVARGVLTAAGMQSFAVELRAEANDGLPPGLLEVKADPELLELAFARRTVQLDVLGIKFWTRVAGSAKDRETLHVPAGPLFRALAKAINAQTRP